MAEQTIGDLIARLKLKSEEFQKGINAAARTTLPLGNALRSIAGIALPVTFGSALVAGLSRAVKKAAEFEHSMARIQGVLRATGNASGLTAQQIDQIVLRIDKATLASANELREAAAKLLTFKSVGSDTFEKVLSLSEDLASTGLVPLSGAIRALGKAAEDPVKGLTSLFRLGVAFTAAQKEQIKALAASGDAAAAFAKELEILEGKVGGAGAAQQEGIAGAWDDFNDSLDHFLEREPHIVAGLNAIASAIKAITPPDFAAISAGLGEGQLGPQLDAVNAKIKALQDKLANTGPLGAAADFLLAPSKTDAQSELNRLLEQRAALEKEIKDRIQARSDAEVQASERAKGAADQAAKADAKKIEAEAKKLATAKATADEYLASLQVQADATQRQAAAALQGAESLEQVNRQLAIEKVVAEATAKAIDAHLVGEAYDNFIEAARQAATEIGNNNAQLESLQKLSQDASQASARAARDTADAWGNAADQIGGLFDELFSRLERSGGGLAATLSGIAGDLVGSVSRASSGGGTGSAGGLGPLSFLSRLGDSVESGVTSAFGRLFGGGAGSTSGLKFSIGPQPQAFGQSMTFNGVTAGSTSLFGGVGSALGGVLGSIGGIFSGLQLNNLINQGYASSLEKVLGKVGALVGGAAGGILGSIYGGPGGGALGGAVGTIAGGALFRGLGGTINAITGKSGLLEGNFQNRAERLIVSGVDVITALIIAGLVKNKPDTGLLLQTSKTNQFGGPFQGGTSSVEGAFGFIGALGSGTGNDNRRQDVQKLVKGVAQFDTSLAAYLKASETALVTAALDLDQRKFSNTKNPEKLFRTRAEDVLIALGVPDTTARNVTKDVAVGDLASTVGGFIQSRREIQDLIKDLQGIGEPANAMADALEEIENKMQQIRLAAPDLGITIDNFDALRTTAIQKLRDTFNKGISDALLGIENPLALTLQTLADTAEQRLREAETAGADLVQVEKLNALERAKAIEQAFAPVDALLDQLRTGAGILSPSQVAANAGADFRALGSQVSAGQFVDPSKLADAARTFLDASRALNASGAAFFQDFDLVKSILEFAKLNVPGLATGGSFTIGGGGYDNVVPLFRMSGGETATITRGGQTDEAAIEVRETNHRLARLERAQERTSEAIERVLPELMRVARRSR